MNRLQLQPEDFLDREGGAVNLQGEARKAVVVAFQERKQYTPTHPLLSDSVPTGLLPLVQARRLARHLRGEAEVYMPFAAH